MRLRAPGPEPARGLGKHRHRVQMVEPTKFRPEKALLLEIVLVAVLIAGGAFLYWGPVASGELTPRWWHWLTLGVLFFGILALHTWRAKHRGQRALHRTIREDAASAAAAGSESDSSEPIKPGPSLE
jgi:type VI protein secretion system component VasK